MSLVLYTEDKDTLRKAKWSASKQNTRSLCSLEATCSGAMSCFVCSLRQAAWLQCLGSALISSFGEQWQVEARRWLTAHLLQWHW